MRYFRVILLFTILVYGFKAEAQIKLKTYTTATDTFYWKRYVHIPKPPKVRLSQFTVLDHGRTAEQFLAGNLDQFPQFTNDSLPKFNVKTLKKCLYPVDINGDHLPDMIFSGYSGGESDLVRIYLNHGNSFELVFEDYQYISKFRKEAGKLVELQTGDVGSGSNYLYFMHEYRVDHENGQPVFIMVKQIVAYRYTEEPSKFYQKPVSFVAKTDTMLLRSSAAQLNEPFFPELGTFGNIVAKYRSKARGVVLAMKTYGKGNDWYFVEVFPDTSPSSSILYDVNRMPTFIHGWVSGQSILRDFK
jgi:hypothetical protein